MNKQWILIVAMLFGILVSVSLSAQTPSGKEIIEKYREQDKTNSLEAKLKMTLINSKGNMRERSIQMWYKTGSDENRKQLIKLLSPPDVAGAGFLTLENSDREDDNWLYLPALRRTRRIAGADKTGSFVGSDFTYEDLNFEDIDNYNYKNIGEETINGIPCWKIESVASNEATANESGYSKRILWIDKQTSILVQAKFYDKQGTYIKLLQASKISQVSGTTKTRAYKLTMENVQNQTKTILEFSEIMINKGVDDAFFSLRYLQR